MVDEEITLVNGPVTGTADRFSDVKIELADDDPVVKALNLKSGQPETEPKTEEAKTEPVSEVKAEPQSPTPPPAEGTATPETKPDKVPYTEDELKALLADPNATLDTSRLDDRGQAIHKEFQRGYTKKFEELKREREEVERRRAEIAAFEERQRQLEAERKYKEDVEQLGEDEANRLKKERDLESRIAQLEAERQAAMQRERLAMQREASEQYRRKYAETAPKYFLPVEQNFEDHAMSHTWGKNLVNEKNGDPLMSLEDGAKDFADMIGVTNFGNLKKIIKANPANWEALKSEIINEYNQKKSLGPNVPSSTNATVTEKPSEKDMAMDMAAFQKDSSAALLERINRRLKEENLEVK
jgi:hypothetical protein